MRTLLYLPVPAESRVGVESDAPTVVRAASGERRLPVLDLVSRMLTELAKPGRAKAGIASKRGIAAPDTSRTGTLACFVPSCQRHGMEH